uniref:Protein FAR1-RELATED SEQUENCE n=1 Tax=Lactuca sativa TaxID=4236 RepID=A0A9R1WR83_LACSA|nr:hypothetical protein LSAT_V11C100013660 [Lactuca sativa]
MYFGQNPSIFTVIKSYNSKEIPSEYLLRRWQKDIILTELLKMCFRYADSDENTQRVALDIFSTVDNCNKDFEKTLGAIIPTSVDIHNLGEILNKGSGIKKRMKSLREVAIEKSKGSECSYCRNDNDHDWRNCPVRKEDEKNNIFKERPRKKN